MKTDEVHNQKSSPDITTTVPLPCPKTIYIYAGRVTSHVGSAIRRKMEYGVMWRSNNLIWLGNLLTCCYEQKYSFVNFKCIQKIKILNW